MLRSEIKVVNPLGLHARAAACLVRLAGKSNSDVRLFRAEKSADAKSILSVLMLSAAKGTSLRIEIDGADERETLREIEELFATGFGEM